MVCRGGGNLNHFTSSTLKTMNREIKFRVWDKEPRIMIYLNTSHDSLMFHNAGNASYYNLQNGSGGDEYELMQFTGLKDKNGKEIYEGDIVDFNGTRGLFKYEVTFSEGSFCYNVFGDMKSFKYDGANYSCEVIGNVYENKDLLK